MASHLKGSGACVVPTPGRGVPSTGGLRGRPARGSGCLPRLLPPPDPGSAVVVAVWSAQDGVDVERLRGVVVEEDAAVVVELGDDHRGLDAVVEDVAGAVPADPGEPGLVQMLLDLSQSGGSRSCRQQPDEGLGDGQDQP
jgi:hypothetical protein